MKTLKWHIVKIWPKLLEWLDSQVSVGMIIKNPIKITPLETKYFAHHPGINVNSTDGEYEIFFTARIRCVKIGKPRK